MYLDTLYGQSMSDGTCSPLQENGFSVLNQTSLSGAITPGTWCVVIRNGQRSTLTVVESFTLTVTHP